MSLTSTYSLKFFLSFSLIISLKALLGQADLTFVSQTDFVALHNTGLNDVWGYVDEQGNEYAIVGTEDGTSIMNLSDPANPVEVFWLPGTNSIWRDPSVFGDYAYISTEAEQGLTIIDMSPLPESNVLNSTIFTGEPGLEWQSAHNCHVDAAGYLYIFGANFGEGGVLIYDVNTTPMTPTFVGAFDNWYVHDGVAFGDTLYLAHVNDGFLSIVDISDPSSPQLLGTKISADSFTHNIWPSDNREVVYTTDELPDAFIAAYDITDVTNIVELDRVQSSPGSDVIPHNTFVLNDYLVTSYYADGITIHDAKYPYNLIEVASYDTYPGQTPTYDGSWGAYAYLPSGIILASDRSEGLFVLQPNYQRAAYLEGIVTNQVTNEPIDNVDVDIVGNDQEELSNSIGFYATGMPLSGTYNVTYSKVGYEPQTISVSISQGDVSAQDVQLVPIEPFGLTIKVEDLFGNPIQNAKIKLVHSLITYDGESNVFGEDVFALFYSELHSIYVGKWGFLTYCDEININPTTNTLTIVLLQGYYDDFTFDFGWTVSGNAVTGMWERGVPNPTDNTVMDGDFDGDCGNMAYVTGNADNPDADFDDLDDGNTILSSPIMDLSSYSDARINFKSDFFCNHGPGAIDDTLNVIISDGINLEVISFGPQSEEMNWSDGGPYYVSIFGLNSSNISVSFQVSDLAGNPNITEAAVDLFEVVEYSGLNEQSYYSTYFVTPNPFQDIFTVSASSVGSLYSIKSLNGAILMNGVINNDEEQIDLNRYSSGIYFISINGIQKKIVKL
tara:strand:- start:4226 stop:6571 length:2346 start_codon:yes stop_codon:yes gene_type:complete